MSNSGSNDGMEYQVVSATGAYAGAMTAAGGTGYGMFLMTFGPNGAAPTHPRGHPIMF
jgi:hypothetical protein